MCICICLCLSMCIWVQMPMEESRGHQMDALEMKFQVVVNYLMSTDTKLGSSAEAVLLSLQFPLQPFLYERMKNRKQNPSSSPPQWIISQVSQLPLACSEVQWVNQRPFYKTRAQLGLLSTCIQVNLWWITEMNKEKTKQNNKEIPNFFPCL